MFPRRICKKKYLIYVILIYTVFSVLEMWLIVPMAPIETLEDESEVLCPEPYTQAVGDVAGPGTLDQTTHTLTNISR